MLNEKYEGDLKLYFIKKDSAFFKEGNGNGSFDLISYDFGVPVIMNFDGNITEDLINKCDDELDEIYDGDEGFYGDDDWVCASDEYIEVKNDRIEIKLQPRVSYEYKYDYYNYIRDEAEYFYIDIPRNKTVSLYELLENPPFDLYSEMDAACCEEIEAQKDYEDYVHMVRYESLRW